MSESFNIYCDESCHLENDGFRPMVLGALWCPSDQRKRLSRPETWPPAVLIARHDLAGLPQGWIHSLIGVFYWEGHVAIGNPKLAASEDAQMPSPFVTMERES